MNKLFVPYSGKDPAPVVINGHRLLIVSSERRDLTANLQLLGGDRVKSLRKVEGAAAREQALAELAEKSGSGIVIAPPEVMLSDLIRSLEDQLPWIH